MSEPAEEFYDEDEIEFDETDLPSMGVDGNPAAVAEDPPAYPAEPDRVAAEVEEDDAAVRSVPRIAIHAFCENPETRATFEYAAADRRLAKAHVSADMGGLVSALEHFQTTPTPDLVVVESFERGQALLNALDSLAQVCDPSTKVIIIGEVNDITLYRELIRRGVSEYLVRPREPMHLIHVIASLYEDPTAAPVGKVISVIGAKGGVGASTLAHNIAWCVAEEMRSATTIVDFDLPFGTAGLDFNRDPTQGVCEALAAPERLDDMLLERLMTKCSDHLSIFAAPATLERDTEHDETAYESVIDVLRGIVPNIVVDLPHIWAPWTKRVLLASDQITLVAAPELASLRNVKNLYDLLKAARPNDPAPRIILNLVGAPKRPEIPVKDFAEAIGVKPLLIMPWDANLFGVAANNASTILEVNSKHKAAEGIRRVAKALSGRDFAEKPKTSLFANLFARS